MAILNASQLTSASNGTYIDNVSGSITPDNVRNLNTNWISSSILAGQTGSMSVGTAATASYILNAVSSSYASNADLLDNLSSTAFVLTSSFNPFSSSVSSRLTAAPILADNNTFTATNNFNVVSASYIQALSASIDYLSVVYQTSSIVYSSGSNQFGDAANDTQTLYGTVNVITGPLLATGSARVTGSLTMAGLSSLNVSHVKANDVQGVEILTNTGTTVATFGAGGSTGVTVVGQVNATSFSGSGVNIFGVVNAQTASYVNLAQTASFITNAATASSVGILNQPLTITGSVSSNVVSASIVTNTASIDFSFGNFYTSLASGSTNYYITNPQRGQTVNLLLTTVGTATASFSPNVKQVSGSNYTPTSGSGKSDVLTFISFDGTTVYLASVQNLI